MDLNIKIDTKSKTPVYKQLIQSIESLVDNGVLKHGEYLPSMNEMAWQLDISKETVKKAYYLLRNKKLIESTQGKGFYVTNHGKGKLKVMLLIDKISAYKQILLSSLLSAINDNSEIIIRLHNQDIELFEHFVDESLSKFDYYIITPHFSLDSKTQKQAIKILKKIPNRKLVLLDRHMKNLPGKYAAVYQDFEQDIYSGLEQAYTTLKKYKRINVMSMPGSLYAPLIKKGIERFCKTNCIDHGFYNSFEAENIRKNETYIILNSQHDVELIELVRAAKKNKLEIGKDIGVISYNESPINEIILNGLTVFSTNFNQMGQVAGEMIVNQSLKKVKCDFNLIRRKTF